MSAAKLKTLVLPAILVLAVGVFVMDLFTPQDDADWSWYLLLMLFSVYVGGRHVHFLLAATLSALTVGGYYLSPPGWIPKPLSWAV